MNDLIILMANRFGNKGVFSTLLWKKHESEYGIELGWKFALLSVMMIECIIHINAFV